MSRAGLLAPLGRSWQYRAGTIALVVYAALLFGGTHVPPPQIPLELSWQVPDKLAHFAAYTGLCGLVLIVIASRRKLWVARPAIVVPACLALAFLGLADEATQPLVGRNFDWFDWVADLGGILCAAIGCTLIVRHRSAAAAQDHEPPVSLPITRETDKPERRKAA